MSSKRCIPSKDFWELVDINEAIKEKSLEWEKWRKAYAKGVNRYLFEINFVTGAIVNARREVVDMMDQDKVSEAWHLAEELAGLESALNKKVLQLAKRYRINPRQIDIRTGEVSNDAFEVIKELDEEDKKDPKIVPLVTKPDA